MTDARVEALIYSGFLDPDDPTCTSDARQVLSAIDQADRDAGWVRVPREPTLAMMLTGTKEFPDKPVFTGNAMNVYKAMLSAAPGAAS